DLLFVAASDFLELQLLVVDVLVERRTHLERQRGQVEDLISLHHRAVPRGEAGRRYAQKTDVLDVELVLLQRIGMYDRQQILLATRLPATASVGLELISPTVAAGVA